MGAPRKGYKKDKIKGNAVQVGFVTNKTTMNKIARLAKRRQVSNSQIVREAVAAYVAAA